MVLSVPSQQLGLFSHTRWVCHLIPCTSDGWRCQKAARRPQRCDRTRSWAALRGLTATHCRIRAPNSPTAPCLSESTPASAKVHHPRLQVNATRFYKLYARSNAPSEAIALVAAAWRCVFKLQGLEFDISGVATNDNILSFPLGALGRFGKRLLAGTHSNLCSLVELFSLVEHQAVEGAARWFTR